MANFLDTLQSKFIIGDLPLESAILSDLLSKFQKVNIALNAQASILEAYQTSLQAGSTIIRTYSAQANRWNLRHLGLNENVSQINWNAAKLASAAIGDEKGLWIAGTIHPLGAPLRTVEESGLDPLKVFIEQIGPLLDGGSDLILFEHFDDLRELSIAIEALRNLHHCPALSFLKWDGAKDLNPSFQTLRDAGCEIMGIQAPATPTLLPGIKEKIAFSGDNPLALMPEYISKGGHPVTSLSAEMKEAGIPLLFFGNGYTAGDIKAVATAK